MVGNKPFPPRRLLLPLLLWASTIPIQHRRRPSFPFPTPPGLDTAEVYGDALCHGDGLRGVVRMLVEFGANVGPPEHADGRLPPLRITEGTAALRNLNAKDASSFVCLPLRRLSNVSSSSWLQALSSSPATHTSSPSSTRPAFAPSSMTPRSSVATAAHLP